MFDLTVKNYESLSDPPKKRAAENRGKTEKAAL